MFNRVRDLSLRHDHQRTRTVADFASHFRAVAVICDIQGPKIRIGKVQEPFIAKTGDRILVTPESIIGSPERIPIQYPAILKDLGVGDKIFVNDGIVQLSVREKTGADLVCSVDAGGPIATHKGCNIPSGSICSLFSLLLDLYSA